MGAEARHLAGQLGLTNGLHHAIDVLIGIGHLLGNGPVGRGHHLHSLGCHMFFEVFVLPCVHRLDPALGPPGPMAAAAKSERIAEAREEMARPPHVSGDEHRLARFSENRRELVRSGPVGAGRPFAVDAEFFTAVDLKFSNVMAHVIKEADLFRKDMEHFLKSSPHAMQNLLPVIEGVIGCCRHGCEILLSLQGS